MSETTFVYPEGSREISGFGGGYEEACRNMVVAGMEWLKENPDANPTFKQYKNVYGITADENTDMKNMQNTMNEAIGNEASGAMMQASTNHVLYAHKNGWEKYIEEMTEKEEEDSDKQESKTE